MENIITKMVDLGYSSQHIYRLHEKALNEVAVP